jgi:hypothetical protein
MEWHQARLDSILGDTEAFSARHIHVDEWTEEPDNNLVLLSSMSKGLNSVKYFLGLVGEPLR